MPRDPHRDQPVLLGGAPPAEAAGALVLLHGRAGSAQDMLALARDLQATPPSPQQFAWLVPEAAGRQWYPFSLLEKPERNRPHLSSALALVKRVLEKIAAAGLPAERVVLLGFSQGASVALEFAARNARRYGGLVALSGARSGPRARLAITPAPSPLHRSSSAAATQTPISPNGAWTRRPRCSSASAPP